MITGAIFTGGTVQPGSRISRDPDLYDHLATFRASGGRRLVYDYLSDDVREKLSRDGIQLVRYLDRPDLPPYERRWFAYRELSHDESVNWFIDVGDVMASVDLEVWAEGRGPIMSYDRGPPNYHSFEWHLLQLRKLPAKWSVILKKYEGQPLNAGVWCAGRTDANRIITQMCHRLSEYRICYPVCADMAAFGLTVLFDLKLKHEAFFPIGHPLVHDYTTSRRLLAERGRDRVPPVGDGSPEV